MISFHDINLYYGELYYFRYRQLTCKQNMDSLIWLGLFLIFEFDFFKTLNVFCVKGQNDIVKYQSLQFTGTCNYNYLMMEVLKKNSIVAPQK